MTLTTADLQAIRQITTETATEVAEKIVGKAINDLSVRVDTKFDDFAAHFGRKIDESITGLAIQVGEGFNEVTSRLDRVEADVSVLKTDVGVLKTDMREVKWKLNDTVGRSEFNGLRDHVRLLEAAAG
jgi:tetrahydromethanopterin S-methyltransferase subunit G